MDIHTVLSEDQALDFVKRGFSRRNFGRIAAMITAGATLPFYNEPALAQLSARGKLPADAVKIDANENPLGPCDEAAAAIHGCVKEGGRYNYDLTNTFVDRYDARAPLGYPALHHLTRPLRRAAAASGDPEGVNLWAGTGIGTARAAPADELLAELATGG